MSVQDARQRVKTYFLDYYLEPTNLLMADAVTLLDFHVMYDDHVLPFHKLFTSKNLDAVYSVGVPTSQPLYNFEHQTYGYIENVPVTIYTIDPTGSNEGTKSLWTCQAELRRIAETYFGGSLGVLRRLDSMSPNTQDMGGWKLYSIKNNLEYKRVNSNFTPTYPTFSYGVAWTYEGDRTSGGPEGTWTLTQGAGSTCTQAVTSDKNLYLDQTVFAADSYTSNGTNLGLASNAYGKIRIRYKTSGAATAKVILTFSDASTQTVLAETASSTFTVVNVSITAGKTTDHVTLYACDGVGTVTYDCVQIYTGTYILPVVTKMDPPIMLNDAITAMPTRSGDHTTPMGSGLLEVTMECDMELEPSALTWKRSQTSTKTDASNTDVFYELLQYSGISTLWTWLDLGNPAMQFKARLAEIRPSYSGESNRIELVWREYRHGSAVNETPSERFGLSL